MLIDPKSNTPIYRQIVGQIQDAIQAGVYKSGEALPSLRALAVEIRVNPNTVQRAYEELERMGVIQSRRGVGVFVVEQTALAARGRAERETAALFRKGVRSALDGEVPPARIRELFESVLTSRLSHARKHS